MAPTIRNPGSAPANDRRQPRLNWPDVATGGTSAHLSADDQRFITLRVVNGLELSAIAETLHIPLNHARTQWSRLRPWVLARLLDAVRKDLAEPDWLLLGRVMGARMTPEEAAESVGVAPSEALPRVLSLAHGPVEDLCGKDAAHWLECATRLLPRKA